ncbi:N-acetyltransferase [Haloferax mediterranei ATCC 33500]|uniref:GCN5 family acetyltransferase n=1 Tax=Haloferax mediterranei (strain ATCC 33500 / DSM 1411 / JCM 8866 / NBRC 14739 / NCIMB 2177 / R-4) TaxID=523841 RepID=I3R7A5_HALMT|nr:GNAT family protein [Haloferax mediterranei]AFK20115.1 GCN5-related N-acetyltransferase [Haloferax mediterranei ATCC 33500]AHZ23488.1 GCN5 family acetyltransferase [Haloferax mediterranei ATCC 33500]ELZ99661.1 N-acetyltransferase GCN5 [Haloferax mediterranei ATCC 33500]MDX5987135.1 GNAT family protein [Haloferax mediterranei ATCC 33500]QCQ76448.1 N-acetyltransferase [Haloferax mediterranei ATCC 33500]
MSDLFPEVIETDRLRLAAATPEAVHPLDVYEVCSKPEMDEVTTYMPWSRHETPKVTKDFLDDCASKWNDAESAQFAVFPREGEDSAGELAGFGGLHTDWDRRAGTLGFWLRPRYWGRGYSGERAEALVALAFDVLDLEIVEVKHAVENENSKRAIEKYMAVLGGDRDGRDRNSLPVRDDVVDQFVYSVSREEWLETTGGEYDAEFYWDASDVI